MVTMPPDVVLTLASSTVFVKASSLVNLDLPAILWFHGGSANELLWFPGPGWLASCLARATAGIREKEQELIPEDEAIRNQNSQRSGINWTMGTDIKQP